ncbi:MAG: rcoM1, partial [Rhizobacter sp.]|nr:rcoM1 [Rhizobacter sp.]
MRRSRVRRALITDSAMAQISPLYLLERFDVGIVHLDDERRVVGMNDLARRTLPVERMQPFDSLVLGFHPERSRPKVGFMLDQAAVCPVSNPPPMTM